MSSSRLHQAVFALAALSAVGARAAEPCPAAIRVSFPNIEIAPYVLGTDTLASNPGLLVDWTSKALAAASAGHCKPAITIVRRPPQRQLSELSLGLLDILPGFGYTARPVAPLAFPMAGGRVDMRLAVMADTVSLYTRAGELRVHWDGAVLRNPRGVVGTSTGGGGAETSVIPHGWQFELAPTPRADLDKLLAGRIDVIMEPDVAIGSDLPAAQAGRVTKLAPPARTTLRYAPVRQDFARQYPQFTARFWLAMCEASRAGGTALPACR